MLYFNSCPRCKTGTVQLGSDFYGSYLSCLNCGFEKSAVSVRKLDYEESKRESGQAAALAAASAPTVVAVEDELFDDEEDDFDYDLDADEEELVELERAVG